MLSMLHALWQADGMFPSGSFAFSYGIEGAIALRPGMRAEEFAQLLRAVVRTRWRFLPAHGAPARGTNTRK